MKSVIIPNTKKFEEKKRKIIKQGKEKLHILTDFDRTLTKSRVNGRHIPSVISILRDQNYLNKEYSKKAKELFNKYHPIEMNINIPLKQKKKFMKKWWEEHFKLLIKSGLNKKHIEKVINSKQIKLRKGVKEFLNLLNKKNIPLIILSSAGLGKESIKLLLKKENLLFQNIYIISNEFIWDKKGKARSIKKPIIHIMNKDETILENFDFFNKIKNRKNVLLIGDSLGDIKMIKGFKYKNLLKVGFLNEDIKTNLKQYKKNFDLIILNDGNFTKLNKIVKEIK